MEGVGVHSIPVVVKVAPHSLLGAGAGGAGGRDLGVAIGSGDQGHTLELPLVLGQPVPPEHLPGGAGEVVDLTPMCLMKIYLCKIFAQKTTLPTILPR